MSNPRFADIEIMLEERNFESAAIALAQVVAEMHDDITTDEVNEFCEAFNGEL